MTEMRRLSDKIIAAHTQACDENKTEVAILLLQALELDISAIGGDNAEHREATEMLENSFVRHNKFIENQ